LLMRDFTKDVLLYHSYPESAKMKTVPSKQLRDQYDLSLAYSPGVAKACQAIVDDPQEVDRLTLKGSLVGVISNGTSVLGLGDIGPLAAKPVMEGKAVLFQQFAKLNAISIEIAEKDPEKLIQIIQSLEPTLGGINLEDIKAPECFIVEAALKKVMKIPVFHDDQHGTAIVVATAVLNALSLTGKELKEIQCVVSGAGAGALACLNLLVFLGLPLEHILVCDSQGVISTDRPLLGPYKKKYARQTSLKTLEEALKGADLFIGLSRKDLLQPEMLAKMNKDPIILALANPDPEITPSAAFKQRSDVLIGTGRSDYPNQVNNLLCFPYIFKGAMDAKAIQITTDMKVAFVRELQSLTQEGFSDIDGVYGGLHQEFGRDYFVPKPFDRRLLERLPFVVAKAAVQEGVANPQFNLEVYREHLVAQAYYDMPFFQLLKRRALRSLPQEKLYLILNGETEAHIKMLSAAKALTRFGLCQICVVLKHEKALQEIVAEYPHLHPFQSYEVLLLENFDLNPSLHCVFACPPHSSLMDAGIIFTGILRQDQPAVFFLEEVIPSCDAGSYLGYHQQAYKWIAEMGFQTESDAEEKAQNLSGTENLFVKRPARLRLGHKNQIEFYIQEQNQHKMTAVHIRNCFWQVLGPLSCLKETIELLSFCLAKRC
jgi:malate dehydrogenase (oxaloacetate-decarboxylating)(NADP+)